jgi:protein-tyrosine kinase
MSRIDEALRRASDGPAGMVRNQPAADVFTSPWEARAIQAGRTAFAEPAPLAPTDSAAVDVARQPLERSLHVVRAAVADRFRTGYRERLAVARDVEPRLIEQYRRVAATLIRKQRADGTKTLMVASANAGEGKTVTALNLALVLSESYRARVLLIDADLRKPTLADAANIVANEGLNEAINAADDRNVPVHQLTETLAMLPAGCPRADPLGGLTSPRMRQLLVEAAERYDWVILDSPPAGATADAGLLCSLVDAAILVLRAGKTPHAAVQHAVEVLGRERIIGVVFNGVQGAIADGYGAGYGQVARS